MSTKQSVPSRLWRQGDILIREYGALPAGCQPASLQHGELLEVLLVNAAGPALRLGA
jgi:hypothetical protein